MGRRRRGTTHLSISLDAECRWTRWRATRTSKGSCFPCRAGSGPHSMSEPRRRARMLTRWRARRRRARVWVLPSAAVVVAAGGGVVQGRIDGRTCQRPSCWVCVFLRRSICWVEDCLYVRQLPVRVITYDEPLDHWNSELHPEACPAIPAARASRVLPRSGTRPYGPPVSRRSPWPGSPARGLRHPRGTPNACEARWCALPVRQPVRGSPW